MRIIYITIFIILLMGCRKEYSKGVAYLDYASNLRLVSVKVNGYNANLILDTGAGITILDKYFAEEIDLYFYSTENNVSGIGGVKQIYQTDSFVFIALGDTMRYYTKIVDLSEVRYKMYKDGYSVHGVLGGDFLEEKGCVIDYNTNTLECKKL
jgi:hypothetical protein